MVCPATHERRFSTITMSGVGSVMKLLHKTKGRAFSAPVFHSRHAKTL
jgi:hypothetical protein